MWSVNLVVAHGGSLAAVCAVLESDGGGDEVFAGEELGRSAPRSAT
jgi:hypothetical protein